jgi:hypothetical protein
MNMTCEHLSEVQEITPSTDGCEDCIKLEEWWIHLRLCMICGHVGCCDESPNKHASKHARHAEHPIMTSFEPGEDWGWCFVDDMEVEDDWRVNGPRFHSEAADELNYHFYEQQQQRASTKRSGA